jgi:hypothetical protein
MHAHVKQILYLICLTLGHTGPFLTGQSPYFIPISYYKKNVSFMVQNRGQLDIFVHKLRTLIGLDDLSLDFLDLLSKSLILFLFVFLSIESFFCLFLLLFCFFKDFLVGLAQSLYFFIYLFILLLCRASLFLKIFDL